MPYNVAALGITKVPKHSAEQQSNAFLFIEIILAPFGNILDHINALHAWKIRTLRQIKIFGVSSHNNSLNTNFKQPALNVSQVQAAFFFRQPALVLLNPFFRQIALVIAQIIFVAAFAVELDNLRGK